MYEPIFDEFTAPMDDSSMVGYHPGDYEREYRESIAFDDWRADQEIAAY